jgi:hypothetical protein
MNQTPTSRFSNQPPLFWVAVASCVLLIIGGLGPWASAIQGILDVSGTDGGDGWFPIVGGLLSLGTLFLTAAGHKRRHSVVLLLVAVVCALVFYVDYTDISDKGPLVDPAWGLWAVLIGSIGLAVSAIGLLTGRSMVRDTALDG